MLLAQNHKNHFFNNILKSIDENHFPRDGLFSMADSCIIDRIFDTLAMTLEFSNMNTC